MSFLKLQVTTYLIIFLHFQVCTAPGTHGLDQCQHHCSEHGHCVKVHASTYECHCHNGWEGTDCSHEIIAPGAYTLDECHSRCSSHGSCVHHHTGHGYICECDPGWHGSHCSLESTSSTSHFQDHCNGRCGSHGRCVRHSTSLFGTAYSCLCESGWHGSHCTMQYSQTGTVQCHNTYCVHGHCVHDSSYHSFGYTHYSCNCNDGWHGQHCDQQITTEKTTTEKATTTEKTTTSTTTTTTTSPSLIDVGLCIHDSDCSTYVNCDAEFKAICYFGQTCACTPINTDQRIRSLNQQEAYDHMPRSYNKDCTHFRCFHGHCVRDRHDREHCQCTRGWTGPKCGIEAHPDPNNHQSHYHSVCNYHGFMTPSGCECHDHWTGATCQYPPGSGHYDHCNNHCGEHGTCTRHHAHNGNVYWNCKCYHGWHGEFCNAHYTYIVSHTHHCHNTYCVHGGCTYFEDTNGYQWYHHCRCNEGWRGDHCDQMIMPLITDPPPPTQTPPLPTKTITTTFPPKTTQQTTLPPASATSSATATLAASQISTTNTPQTSTGLALTKCNHVDTLSAIAQQTSVSNKNAYECSPGLHSSHEALVLGDCSVPPSPSLWKQGAHVMTGCSNANAIPNYTPIAAFDNGQYSSRGSLSGIFLGCTSDGFKMVVQTCGQTPYIAELHIGGSNTQNPDNYFTIS